MSALFQELDYRQTPIGALSLRRRLDPASGREIHEIKLDDDYLMSSLFTDGEVALAQRALAAHAQDGGAGQGLQVAVGGLGLGYTAQAALDSPATAELLVVEALPAVIDWHRSGLLPLGARLCGDPRCRLVRGDFFALAAEPETGLDPQRPGRRFDLILLDIDHAPDAVLHPGHAPFYTAKGLRLLRRHLRPGGIFALWSNDPPDAGFRDLLAGIFEIAEAQPVTVHRATGEVAGRNTVYLGRTSATAPPAAPAGRAAGPAGPPGPG